MSYKLNISTGVLIINLGSPSAPTSKAVRKYLAEFLLDKRVVEIPHIIWWFILYGIILPFRSSRSAKLYQTIWTEQGSPLINISKRQAEQLQISLQNICSYPIKVSLGMRYGEPAIATALEELKSANIKRLIIFPLYPQYASASSGSAIAKSLDIVNKWRYIPEIHIIDHYAEHPDYIYAISQSIIDYWQENKKGEKLLFSFHGIPKRSIHLGDPYYDLCMRTANLIATQLNLTKDNWLVVFQSRFGKQEWLQPYCDKALEQLAKTGIKTVDIICPGFAADCLETLEEIKIRNQEYFLKAGGEQLNYIPALNTSSLHIDALSKIISPYLKMIGEQR